MSPYKGMTSPLEMISGVNYFIYVKKLDFDVIWPGRPFNDLTLIKGHYYCINREKVLTFFIITHHTLSVD
jgi:hypothetical protein